MLAYFTFTLVLSAFVASQPLDQPANRTELSFMPPRAAPRADPLVPSCGLLIDEDQVGNIMKKNGQCNSISKKAKSFNLNLGCVCGFLTEAGCDKDNIQSWSVITGNAHYDYDLTHRKAVKWYQCFTEQSETQDIVNRFADYLTAPRPTITEQDGKLHWE